MWNEERPKTFNLRDVPTEVLERIREHHHEECEYGAKDISLNYITYDFSKHPSGVWYFGGNGTDLIDGFRAGYYAICVLPDGIQSIESELYGRYEWKRMEDMSLEQLTSDFERISFGGDGFGWNARADVQREMLWQAIKIKSKELQALSDALNEADYDNHFEGSTDWPEWPIWENSQKREGKA